MADRIRALGWLLVGLAALTTAAVLLLVAGTSAPDGGERDDR